MIYSFSHPFYNTHENSKLQLVDLKLSQFLSRTLCILRKLPLFSSIMSLNNPSSPATILATIIAICVNAVNRSISYAKLFYMGLVRFIHISLKLIKGLPLTFYSSTTIISKLLIIRVITAIYKMMIFRVKSCIGHSVSLEIFSGNNSPSATTRFRMSIFQIISFYQSCISTITKTFKNRTSLLNLVETNNFEFPEFLSRQFTNFSHIESIAKWKGLVNKGGGDNFYQLNKYQYA